MKRIKVSIKKLKKKHMIELERFIEKILRADPSNYLKQTLYVTCFNETCIIHEKAGKLDKVTLLYSGLWIGLLINNRVYLSPIIYEKIYSVYGFRAAIKVNEIALKNFLYGRDIFEESIIEKYPPLNNPLAVLDDEYRVVGVVEPYRRDIQIYRNIYDLGLFLREFEK